MVLNKKFRHIVASLLVLLSLASFTACGKDKEDPEVMSGTAGQVGVTSEVVSSGNTKDETDNKTDTSNTESEEPSDELDSNKVTLVGTKFSWELPDGFEKSSDSKGFLCIDEDNETAIMGRRLNLASFESEYSKVKRVTNEILKSRVYDLVFTEAYSVKEGQIRNIAVDNQEGVLFEGTFQTTEGSEGKYSIFAMQHDSDLIFVMVSQGINSNINAFNILNTVSVSESIHT